MKRIPSPGANLSDSFHRQLNMYALAAGAAGVGTLALAQPADAKIIYTPAHRVIKVHEKYQLDLNHDGKIDFTIANSANCATDECFSNLFQQPAVGNGVMGYTKATSYYLAWALKRGVHIGPRGQFLDRTAEMVGIRSAYPFSYVFGKWVNVQGRYLGLRFKVKGQTHYGWARLSVQVVRPPHPSITATLTGYAYETIPDKPIIAGATKGPHDAEPTASLKTHRPEPVTLGELALGASGLSIWRREESVAAALEYS